MRWEYFTLLLVIGTVSCSEDDSNEVIIGSSIKPPVNLDTNLRKALLKALVELENEEKENHDRNIRNDYVNIITHLDTRGKTVEKASASAVSYFTQSEPVNMTVTVKKTTSKPKQIIVVQKSKGVHHKTIYDNDDLDLSETPEQFIASASSSFTSGKLKSEDSDNTKVITGGARLNSVTSKGKTRKLKQEQTTTTTARPTTSTEESEANVESLQFFSAPLVAAFTVHQDEKGLPRSVVPIYNQVGGSTSTTEKQLEDIKKNEQAELKLQVLKQKKELEARQEEELRKQQKTLEEEIKRLTKLKEDQERIIKEQKFAYEQNVFQQQKKLFEEQKRLFNNRQPFVPINTTPTPIQQSSNQLNDNRNFRANTGTLVAIQPSVGFIQPTSSSPLPLNGQILPVKNAIDFRTPFASNFGQYRFQNNINQEPRPILPNPPVLPFSSSQNIALPVRNTFQHSLGGQVNVAENSVIPLRNTAQNAGFFQNLPSSQPNVLFRPAQAIPQNSFSSTQNLPFVSLQSNSFRSAEPTSQTHGTRSLRQESGTGNFLNNNQLSSQDTNPTFFTDNRFNRIPFIPQPVQQPQQFFRPNVVAPNPSFSQYNTLQYSVDQPFFNQRLNNLLHFSGLGQGRQQEDLNIVSKVLSLNHVGGQDSQFASSNVDDRRLRTPPNWRVV